MERKLSRRVSTVFLILAEKNQNSKIDFTSIKGRFTDMKGIPKTAVNVIQSAFDSGIKVLR